VQLWSFDETLQFVGVPKLESPDNNYRLIESLYTANWKSETAI